MNTLTTSQQFAKSLTDVSDSEYRRLRTNFDNFLDSTPLLKHFIACDENGEPIEKPTHYDEWLSELEKRRLEWSKKIFTEATAISSLRKLEDEIKEVEEMIVDYPFGHSKDEKLHEEYADCLMCLFDSAGRLGITPETIFKAFEKKLIINENRNWVKNKNNTYSHVK